MSYAWDSAQGFIGVSSSERSSVVRLRAELVRTELARFGGMTTRKVAGQDDCLAPETPDDEVAFFDA
ncbi:hypothetical protein OYT13_01325 [Pandoraea sp. XJJ-1]|uniref:hypothetical protein n=1 Tax=unclassified Pandoraea TaxID=2624094 RepID=UPI0003625CF2|nr:MULTISPECIES: hypothetical protein [unclassified Pandoraea]OJY21322.1 MAG: hypothetical protein BGP02_19980 [Pandoraea sp. 64-18]WAL83157.1 hypothetical protein OYT13_01325 [Pandoraea sp. XJJ-1]BDD91657.1 hypothetical protein PanNE5_10970 [Pandoraea sp. NE5]